MIDVTKRVIDESRSYRKAFGTSLVAGIKKYILEHYQEEMLLTCVASHMHYSPNYLGALFKKETGITIHDYWHSVRMDHAKQLLKQTSLYIFEIAEQVGYSDQYYFSALFKKYTGVSPKHFRS